MEALPLPSDLQSDAADAPPRVYVTCCVRLSPEKEPERFVNLVAALQRLGTFAATGAMCLENSALLCCTPPCRATNMMHEKYAEPCHAVFCYVVLCPSGVRLVV